MSFLRPIQWYGTTLMQIQYGQTVPLSFKAFTAETKKRCRYKSYHIIFS